MTDFDLIWTDEEKQEAEKEAYNQALEDFAEKLLDWKPQDEEYRSFKDVVNEIKEQLIR